MNPDEQKILEILRESRGVDFSGYRSSMIERRISRKIAASGFTNSKEYFEYLTDHPEEIDRLLNALTINVSRFFRETLTFEYLGDKVLPPILIEKSKDPDASLRIWSAGCASGEEAYSVAILLLELLKKENSRLSVQLFATDIDKDCLSQAQKGFYRKDRLKGIKYGLIEKYFIHRGEWFELTPEIRNMVSFSVFNLLDSQSLVPPESVYGDFDLILCRNVLIFFNLEIQDQVFQRLYRSLIKGGILVLGEAETPSVKFKHYFHQMNECCHIYRKV